jgi:hypothetical protein
MFNYVRFEHFSYDAFFLNQASPHHTHMECTLPNNQMIPLVPMKCTLSFKIFQTNSGKFKFGWIILRFESSFLPHETEKKISEWKISQMKDNQNYHSVDFWTIQPPHCPTTSVSPQNVIFGHQMTCPLCFHE